MSGAHAAHHVVVAGYVAATAHAWAIAQIAVRASRQAYLVYSAKFQPPSILQRLYPSPAHGAGYAAVMERLGLSVQGRTSSPRSWRPDCGARTIAWTC